MKYAFVLALLAALGALLGLVLWPTAAPVTAQAPASRPGVLKVIKLVDGGPDPASAFTINVTDAAGKVWTHHGSASGHNVGPLPVGPAMVAEPDGPANYVATYTGDCDPATGTVDIAPGTLRVCTITNVYVGEDQGGPGHSGDHP